MCLSNTQQPGEKIASLQGDKEQYEGQDGCPGCKGIPAFHFIQPSIFHWSQAQAGFLRAGCSLPCTIDDSVGLCLALGVSAEAAASTILRVHGVCSRL